MLRVVGGGSGQRREAQGRERELLLSNSIERGYSKTSLTGGRDADRQSATPSAPAQTSVVRGGGGVSVR